MTSNRTTYPPLHSITIPPTPTPAAIDVVSTSST